MRKIVLSIFAVLMLCFQLTAQNQRVTGTVVGEDGKPIAGVTVLVAGEQRGTTTDAEGRYAIQVPNDGTLSFTFLGFKEVEEPVAGKSVVNVTMKTAVSTIDDVVVVAFGEQKKEAFTGSAGVLKADELSKRQASNISNALAGQLPGVQIRSSDGQPGNGSSIRIRGFSSMYAGNDPLIIVDGAPYTASLSTLNMADIETFTVQKDAASNALYGARGANGVVMITTKKGRSRDAVITVDMKWGVNDRASKDYDVIKDPAQYYETYYKSVYDYNYNKLGKSHSEAWAEANQTMLTNLGYNVYNVPTGESLIGDNHRINPNATMGNTVYKDGVGYYIQPDDWNDAAYRTALRQEYNVSISGGSDRASFYASVGYLDDNGIVAKSYFDRFTARLKADYQAKKWLKVGANVDYTHSKQSVASGYNQGAGSSGNIFSYTAMMGPIYPVYMRDAEGNIMIDERGMQMYDYGNGGNGGLKRPVLANGNPLAEVRLNDNSVEGNSVHGYGFAEITFLKDFKFNINGTVFVDEGRTTDYTNPFYGQNVSQKGIIFKAHSRDFSVNYQQLLSWSHTYGRHQVDAMIGHEWYDHQAVGLSGQKDHMYSSSVLELSGAINLVNASSSRDEYNTEGYFGRLQYSFDNKYFLSGSYRRDASSRFHPDHRWGNFWSIGAAWLINRENFMQDAQWVNMLKLKVSYGSQGNDGIGSYQYTNNFRIRSANGDVATEITLEGNPNITWEKNGNLNVGVEFELLGSRLNGSVEFYRRKTSDLLFWLRRPEASGFRGYYGNIGDMRNSGVEVQLTGVLFQTKNFFWSISANLTHNSNKILSLPPDKVGEEGGFTEDGNWYRVGGTMYNPYTRRYAGVNDKGEAQWYLLDGTTTTIYENADRFDIGTVLPKLYGGFSTYFQFYGVDLTVNFDYQIGGKVYDGAYAGMLSPSTGLSDSGGPIHKDILKAWSTNNTSSNIPRFQYMDQYSSGSSDRFYTDASYLNLQSINLGYTLPQKWTQKIGVSNVRIYCSAENITYWSKRKGLDPRQSYGGDSSNQIYSPIRTISGGLQFSF